MLNAQKSQRQLSAFGDQGALITLSLFNEISLPDSLIGKRPRGVQKARAKAKSESFLRRNTHLGTKLTQQTILKYNASGEKVGAVYLIFGLESFG